MRSMRKTPLPAQRFPSSLNRIILLGALAAATLPLGAKAASPALETARQLNEAFIELAETVSPSVVVNDIMQKPDYHDWENANPLLEMLPPELRKQYEERSERRRRSERSPREEPRFDGRGSGIVLRKDGYILTNTHVVEGAEKIKVRFKNGKEYPAEVRGTDPQSDVAVIKIEADDLTVAKLGNSSRTRVGEFAIAVGAPFDLDYSVTFGHVSAKSRGQVVPSFGENSIGAMMDQDFIQTDASINPGNSGGPLVNINGEVIGMNTLIQGLHTGIGFAIPIDRARRVADELISEGKVTRAWIGVSVEEFKKSELKNLVEGVEDGLVVSTILTDGPALKSELRPSDIITSVNGRSVSTAQHLRDAVREKRAGSEIALDVLRPQDDKRVKRLKITVRSEAWPENRVALSGGPFRLPREAAPQFLGLTVQALTKELAEKFGVELTAGVVVTDVKPGSPAEQKRIKPGDIITEVDHKPVATPRQFREAVKGATHPKGVIVNLVREGAPRFEILKDSGD